MTAPRGEEFDKNVLVVSDERLEVVFRQFDDFISLIFNPSLVSSEINRSESEYEVNQLHCII
jgi:hypothetical protein